MNEILQIIGSVASILGVPLAIYLYLKNRTHRYEEVRREVVKKLSHQIGEGRNIGLFELNAVIDSLVRENRLQKGAITGNSVVEDLIAETVSSPLLDSSRKEQLISELSEVHSIGKVFQKIQNDSNTFEMFLEYLKVEKRDSDEIDKFRNGILESTNKTQELWKIPELFALIALIISGIIGGASSLSVISKNSNKLSEILYNNFISNILLGIGVSILTAIIVGIVTMAVRNKST